MKESFSDTPHALKGRRLLNVAAQKTFSALTERREKEARPSSRGPCHHSHLLGSSHPISPDTCVRLWFAYAMQCVLCARSGGLWHTVVFLPAEPIYCGTRKHYSVFKVLPRVYHKQFDFATVGKYNGGMEKKEKTLTIRLPADLLEDMRELAHEHTRSLNGEVLVALREYVKQQRARAKAKNA